MTRREIADRGAVVDELIEAAPRAVADTVLFQQAVADRLGLNVTEVKCLGPLAHGGRLTVGAIADRLSLTPGAVTRIVDRLEHEGYVRREQHRGDGRKVVIAGIPERLSEVSAIYTGMAEAWRATLADCSDKELEFLRELLRKMHQISVVEIAKLRSTP